MNYIAHTSKLYAFEWLTVAHEIVDNIEWGGVDGKRPEEACLKSRVKHVHT